MGIGNQEMQFLVNVSQHGPFGKTITAGRQGLHVQKQNVEYFLKIVPTTNCSHYLLFSFPLKSKTYLFLDLIQKIQMDLFE